MRQSLADYLRNLGQIDRADAVYAGLLQESHGVEEETQALGLYAQYLAQTDRGAQGEKLLKDFLTAHSDLEPTQKSNVFFHLANLARMANDETRATHYEHTAEELQPKPPPPPAGQLQIGDDIRNAELAVAEHRPDDAYRLILQAIDKAGNAY